MRLSPPPMIRFICELPPEARVVMITPGQDAGQLPVQIAGDRLAGARPLAPRHQPQRHVGPVGAAAHGAAAARLREHHLGFGHELRHHALEPRRDILRALDPRADRQFRRHADFSLVRLRHQLEADGRQDQDGGDDRRRADPEHRRTVHERLVDQPAVAVVHARRRTVRSSV